MGRLGYGELEAGAETAAAQAFHPQGTVSSPGLSFSGDANTGWYLQGEDTIGHVVGGVEQFRVSSAAFTFLLSTAISSSGTLTITAPTITTPTIASTGWANANHIHAGSTTGGTVALSAATGTLAVDSGGTGTTSLTDKAVLISQDSSTDTVGSVALTTSGQIIVGGASGPTAATLTAGTNVTITNGDGSISIAAKGAIPNPFFFV